MKLTLILLILTAAAIFVFLSACKKARQLKFIDGYRFSGSLRSKLFQMHPHLSEQQADLVLKGLTDYFRICHMAKKRMVSMPSQIVDDAWHEFILSTRSYQRFCARAFGRFLHHTPAEAMLTRNSAQVGIKRAWRLACAIEKINPNKPDRLPLLFAIDGLLNVENGFVYRLNCMTTTASGAQFYCASHIGCSSGCSGGSGADASCSHDGSDCNSGCSGSGCSGGCGGD